MLAGQRGSQHFQWTALFCNARGCLTGIKIVAEKGESP